MWLIESSDGEQRSLNHYLSGEPPFRIDDYRRWMTRMEFWGGHS